MDAQEIRQTFLDFFKERGHMQFPSMSLVPTDPTISTLFTIAGMQQMIPYFLGREEPPSRRIVNVQKGIRTRDIEEVGDDSHLTFLEMLGNFSIGDYFKHEAIAFTWEFLTKIMGIPEDRWYATIYPGDEEARQAWIDAGMRPERIGETIENWWQQGPVGPCGPDSEIHYDRGIEYSCGRADCRPENECCDRYIETWNNVFMTFFQEESGAREELPFKNIDTGMGFERLVMIAQGAESVYDTDLFVPILRSITDISGAGYRSNATVDRSFRIIADHSRAIAFIIADGVMPAAEGRGYVLRRLLRRAVLRGRMLGIERPFLSEPVSASIDTLGGYWTELAARRPHILQVVQQEEQRFLQTLARGLAIFEDIVEHAVLDSRAISGADAFTLYDTHGFPLEITKELAEERGVGVEEEEFRAALREQRDRAKMRSKYRETAGTSPETYSSVADIVGPTTFSGYEELHTPTGVVAIIAEGKSVQRALEGDEVEVVLATTPFYAESGGQVGDAGVIRGGSGTLEVTDTQRPIAPLIVHKARVTEGTVSVGDAVDAEVDEERRIHILPHHSGTHLLHKALQEVLGPEATQAGSLVAPDRLRFDFRWPRPVTLDELRDIQDRVNAAIWANLPVRRQVMSYDEAMREGAMALFGEKYGERVRVISIGDWSKELCGGTHVNASGDIGLLIITSETGIGSGIRRIEALAGAAAYAHVNNLRDYVGSVAKIFETRPDALLERAQHVLQQSRAQEKRIEELARRLAALEAETLVRDSESVNGFKVVVRALSAESATYLEAATDAVKSRLENGIVVLGSVVDGAPRFTAAVTKDLENRGFKADAILREAMSHGQVGGGAGGRPAFAKGGGKDPSKVQTVLQSAIQIIKEQAEK